MASGRCSGGGGSFYSELMGCLGGGGDDEAAENAPAEVVREVALEPASPTPAGETYEQHLARARSPRRPAPCDAGDDDSGDEILRAAAARWPLPPSDPRPAAREAAPVVPPATVTGDASRPPPPAATVCKPCAPVGASEDPRRSHHATGGRAYEI